MTPMHWSNFLAYRLCLFWGGYVHAVSHMLNSAPLPWALKGSWHFQAQLMVLPWFSDSFREFGSWSLLWVGDRNLSIAIAGYCLPSQEGLTDFSRAQESHCTDATWIHTVGLQSILAPALEINSSFVLGFFDWKSRGYREPFVNPSFLKTLTKSL